MPSPKPAPVVLSDEEYGVLGEWSRRRMTPQALAMRARIVLRCAEGSTIGEVAAGLGVSRDMVSKWRSRFLDRGLEGLSDQPRPGRPREITEERVERVITTTLADKPRPGAVWSTRSMATATGMSQSAVSRIWRAFGLKPHAVETWRLSTDPRFIDKLRDVVCRYLAPPAAGVPTSHGPLRRATGPFAASDISIGSVIARHRRHRHQEFPRFLKLIDAAVPEDLDLRLVLDDHATHRTPRVREWLIRHPRFHPRLTLASDSLSALLEHWFAGFGLDVGEWIDEPPRIPRPN